MDLYLNIIIIIYTIKYNEYYYLIKVSLGREGVRRREVWGGLGLGLGWNVGTGFGSEKGLEVGGFGDPFGEWFGFGGKSGLLD
jgi:hypothetical protein